VAAAEQGSFRDDHLTGTFANGFPARHGLTRSDMRDLERWLGPQAWKLDPALEVIAVELFAGQGHLKNCADRYNEIIVCLGYHHGQDLAEEAPQLVRNLLRYLRNPFNVMWRGLVPHSLNFKGSIWPVTLKRQLVLWKRGNKDKSFWTCSSYVGKNRQPMGVIAQEKTHSKARPLRTLALRCSISLSTVAPMPDRVV
jgi:hypothetical protein